MGWLFIAIGGLLEIAWASGLKYANTSVEWLMVVSLIVISYILLLLAYRTIPVSIAYIVFVGVGTVGTYLVGIFLGEPFSIYQIIFLLFLFTGIIGMKCATKLKKETKGRGI